MEPVHVERFYLGCLAHASYMIVSEGVAAIIDPQRDVDIYIEAAARNGWQIRHIIETHVHADFVSGHHELAQRTRAQIYLGANSGAQFPHVAVNDNNEICFGQCCLRFLQTPGHTLESICIAMTDLGNPARPAEVFTGDTLFVGDVGRPDLSPSHTPQQLAELLYSSIHQKLLTLPDETRIYPAHGAGSLCGRQMGSESFSTIGEQRRTNYALHARKCEEFVHLLTDNLPAAPEYFAQEVDLNRKGAAPISALPTLSPLSAADVIHLQNEGGAIIVDTRPATHSPPHTFQAPSISHSPANTPHGPRASSASVPRSSSSVKIPITSASRNFASPASAWKRSPVFSKPGSPAGSATATPLKPSRRSQRRISPTSATASQNWSPSSTSGKSPNAMAA